MTILRPRQKRFVERSLSALKEHGNTLSVASTGFGKTICLSAVTQQHLKRVSKNTRACVLAHRDELVNQNRDKFAAMAPNLSTSLVNAQEKSWAARVTFAMVPTLSREANLAVMPPLDLLVIDEAHHAVASTYRAVINRALELNPQTAVFGLTATPLRGDAQGLRPVFSNVADQVSIGEIIRDGHLVPPRTFVIDVGVQGELKEAKRTNADFDMNAVEAILDQGIINEAVVSHWQDKAFDRKTIVFCATVKHANNVCEAFVSAGIKAAVIDGDMAKSDRQALIQEFDQGDLQVLLNCFVLTEGFDSQPVSCVVLLRPSSQKSTFIQCVGRGLRTVDPALYPGIVKTDCMVLDFGISSLLHGSLETDVDLDSKGYTSDQNKPDKDCPECGASVPSRTQECPLCGFEWGQEEPDVERTLGNFVMSEVDLLAQSAFLWTDIFGDDAALLATGFSAWAGMFFLNGQWYGLGGGRDLATRLLAVGARTVCLASANDWLHGHETEDAAQKSKRWLKQPATPAQLNYLPSQYRNDYSLTRYHASCLLAFKFNKKDIQKYVFGASKRYGCRAA